MPNLRAKCKKNDCQELIMKKEIRVGALRPNHRPLSSEDERTSYTEWYHLKCIFEVQENRNWPELQAESSSLQGFGKLKPNDRALVATAIETRGEDLPPPNEEKKNSAKKNSKKRKLSQAESEEEKEKESDKKANKKQTKKVKKTVKKGTEEDVPLQIYMEVEWPSGREYWACIREDNKKRIGQHYGPVGPLRGTFSRVFPTPEKAKQGMGRLIKQKLKLKYQICDPPPGFYPDK